MIRRAFHARLKPGAASHYRRLHRAIAADVLDELRRAGVHNYSIFSDGDHLFGYLEIEDQARFVETMRESDPNLAWTREVSALFAKRPVDETGFLAALDEVFHFD